MTRCDYDTVFYRVFCVTLLAIAFTFTVILTNVFVDIDGLLASKNDKLEVITNPNEFTKYATEAPDIDETNYSESDDSYRTKRSIETQSYLFHIKNPKVKTILANKLSTLLEELEAEDSEDARIKPEVKKISEALPQANDKQILSEEIKKRDEILHIKLHNIILQGIADHMDLNNVFKKINNLKPEVKEFEDMKDGLTHKPIGIDKEGDNTLIQKPMEDRFLAEMLHCKDLHKQIVETATVKPSKDTPKVVIKTVIDITSENKDIENDTRILNENIQGDIELVYNGKILKFTRSEAKSPPSLLDPKLPAILKPNPFKPKKDDTETTTAKEAYDYNMVPRTYMDKFVDEYFKHFPHDVKLNNEINQHFETKRLKRHVRIKYENDKSGEDEMKKNTEEDELYVEIETHFDTKGIKGEKKKKIIKNLIEKIQKAIHSDMTGKLAEKNKKNDTVKHRKRIHFRKRSQNPLKNINEAFIKRINSPLVQRELHTISKTVLPEQRIPQIDTKSEEWNPKIGPGFLSNTKSINSAEMSEVDVDYSKILEVNGIPQRLQQPLNTELSEETIKTNSYYDVGNTKYIVKGIDGSGFSVGFNQYVDSPPDQDAMRMFSGLENMIKTYHNMYDQTPMPETTTEASYTIDDEEIFNENSPYNEHTVERRSINKERDYHSNEYKIIFDKNRMPFNSYHDVYNMKPIKAKATPILEGNKAPLVLDENIFEKNLKPSEILSLANLFQRKKRAVKIQKFLTKNVNRKTVSRFLNTNAMSTKTIFLNRKRNKRQINKIRIIATDIPQNYRQSDENMFVESDENIFADRALLKEREDSYTDHERQEENDFMNYKNSEPDSYINNILKRRSRQNPLMSKYPHVFLEEAAWSGEEFHIPNNVIPTYLPEHSKIPEDKIDIEQLETSSTNDTEFLKQLQEQQLINSPIGSPTNSNYKVTVKIIPKNESDLHSGFKEMHTTINKSFNKNGLLYSSLVNVSEISKVMNLNNTRAETEKEEKERDNKKFGNEEMFLSKSIYDQQEKMQFLLKEHARHISEQLNRLQQEKNNLDFILNGENNTEIKYLKVNPLSMHIEQQVNVEKDNEVAKTVEKTEGMVLNEVQAPVHRQLAPNPIEGTTAIPVTQLPSLPKPQDNDIIQTIERNGNLTDQILKKIDRNTAILQLFLNKLTERIDMPNTSSKPDRDDNTLTPVWGKQGMQYPNNMVIRKNDSHVSLPFTYASIPASSKKQANGIYQGHVRNFNVHNNNQIGPDKVTGSKISELKNKSRFFIDGIENEYKVIQLGDFNKNRDYNSNLIVNGTLP